MTFLYIDIFIQLLSLAIFVRVILSWITSTYDNFFTRFIFEITEPILSPLRRITSFGSFDLSPMVAIIMLEFIREIIRRFFA